ncbi:MAG TPA: sigma-54-dependent Fis family transcriptional regulator [Deltaproteobacteria bacterium]|nr:MAG: hypothetical protein A2Z79_10370 [Deltaproteobacteria bacterium GWA2_55_82]OGQ62964.1 MAG: hypothetical protein A3I81_06595 [Deltaproteobacteria bacterium RIFCSPLOWO2_02_FULL_55_12]OIJ72927.1 MAG: hypothetical protein A2V21_300835 [Deltaproteobacteria bacterium GWC2_55_46]HBG46069.1 sigma-54-dependent Fis family transcriptional regulator [Deltaproteobacteria bacterium]HCY11713.1 sigma-54-dependent Fis family transcriptional regulator [Deltaproteobacteria bacterium]
MTKPRLLVLDDDETVRGQMRWAFCRDYEVLEAETRGAALRVAREQETQLGVIDLGLPPAPLEPSEGMTAIREILSINPLFKAVIITGLDERQEAFRALDLGAFDYFTKPVSIDEVRVTLKRGWLSYRQQAEHLSASSGAGWPNEMIGVSAPMQEVFRTIRKAAEVNIPALIAGEHGSGKETAARAMHRLGIRHAMQFISVDCAGTPHKELENELFGLNGDGRHGRKCRFEQADGGTIYMKEVGALSLSLQGRLLRVLREHAIERPDSNGRTSIDVRVISSTAMDLRAMARSGEFSEELLHRIGVITLEVPPLKDRGDDVYLLALYFLKKHSREFNKPVRGFDKECVGYLKSYRWHGNVRELENRVRRAVIFFNKSEISGADLGIPAIAFDAPKKNSMGLAEARDLFKRRMVQEALSRSKWNVARAAAELGISRQYLSKLITKYNLSPA